ncbi:MAG TPA: hypothetical protein VGM64_00065 [Lacunisphaera sp.]|jgi:hypothetical protein
MGEQISFADFLLSIAQDASPPGKLGLALKALWHDRRGDWGQAHELAQKTMGKDGSWVHAYLHRREGDATNADYWYRLTGRAPSQNGLDEEWAQIAKALLNEADD